GGGAADDGDALAAEVGEALARRIDLGKDAAAVDEGDQAEVDQPLPPEGPGGGAALDVDLPAPHRVDAVLHRELHPAGLERALQLLGDAVGDRAAELHRVAPRLAVDVDVGEGRGAVDVAQADDALLGDGLEGLRPGGEGKENA